MLRIIYLYFGILIILSNVLFSQNLAPKKGGICFRIDDNRELSKFNEYAAIFDKYDQKFSFSLNLAEDEFGTDFDGTYKTGIKQMQNNGHELMDHTPNQRTNYFTTKYSLSEYQTSNNNILDFIEGIDHIVEISSSKNKICLEIMEIDTNQAIGSGKADLISSGDSVVIHNYSWQEILINYVYYLYFPEIDQLVVIPLNYSGSTQPIEDFWGDQVNVDNCENLTYYSFDRSQIHLTKDAIKVLANESLKLANEYGFSYPKTWIQPGGIFPWVNKLHLKEALEELNYLAGATYPGDAKQVFNEYNPTNDLNFAMQWGDFLEDEKDLEYNKSVIAQDYAKHHMLIGHSFDDINFHWEEFLIKTDSLIAWAVRLGIPIKTYSEWADILYNQNPDPYENIFPPLNVDLDNNGIPDGYGNLYYSNDYYIGTWEIDSELLTQEGYCYSISSTGGIARVQDLGGIEKGKNNFEIWTKGEQGDSIEVTFEYSYVNDNESTTFKFPANTTNWTKYDLSQSVNGNTELIVPDTMSTIFIYIECSNYTSGNVKVSGMSLSKFGEPISNYSDDQIVGILPTEYNLGQNYPNPFNPTTHIKFSLPESVKIKVNVYNLLGEKVASLMDSELEAGIHEVQFNTNSGTNPLASGVYIYTIESQNFTQAKKMLLLK
ncbi:MAG: T9SS type A sorting domain-containing protein [Ignavibacteriae bacterium]|nr:T9SS type A sorting domain-containing protein [Ignavibacteriota bacterium]